MSASVKCLAAVVLACAALFLENCCRVPDPPGRGPDDQPAPLR